MRDNAASLLRIARKHSLCDDDAADAYQRTLEIYIGRVERIDHATAGAWLRTVCKHEAIRLRGTRQRVAPSDPMAWDERPAADPHEAEERAESLERVARAAEALQACRPDEARAMLLRADGSSYAEIGELCGWSYSKVNRSLAEGRARFLARFARIESGAACAGYAGILSAIVDGEATPDDYLRLRPHLRHCGGCRATLKAMYESEPALGALVPAGALVLAAPDGHGFLTRAFESVAADVGDRLVRAHALIEAASASKAAAVVASTAAVAAGGAAVAGHAGAERARAGLRAAALRHPPSAERRAAAKPSVAPVRRDTRTPMVAGAAPVPAASPPPPAPTADPTPSATASPTPRATPTQAREFAAAPSTASTAVPHAAAAPPSPAGFERAGTAASQDDEPAPAFGFEG